MLNSRSSMYFQAVQGDSAVEAGIKLLPMLISVVISSMLSGGLTCWRSYFSKFLSVSPAYWLI